MAHRSTWTASLLAAALALGGAGSAGAAQTDAEKCQLGRIKAAAKYHSCMQKVLTLNSEDDDEDVPLAKCRRKYAAAYPKLRKLTASPCAELRLVDNGDGTVTDNLTGLQWEQKTDNGSIHDLDNSYTWSAAGTAADGASYTAFAAGLNAICFAGHCDWRVPTLAELSSLLLPEPFPCAAMPCTDPVLGPVDMGFCYWTSSTAFHDADLAWDLCFFTGGNVRKNSKTIGARLRAVRGGL